MTENSLLPCDVLAIRGKKVTTDLASGPTSSDGVLGLAGALAGRLGSAATVSVRVEPVGNGQFGGPDTHETPAAGGIDTRYPTRFQAHVCAGPSMR